MEILKFFLSIKKEYPKFYNGVWDIADTKSLHAILRVFVKVSYFNVPDGYPHEHPYPQWEDTTQKLYDHIKNNKQLHSFWLL